LDSRLNEIIKFELREIEPISHLLRLFLTIRLCGGFNILSIFSFETGTLLKVYDFLLAFINIFANVTFCISGTYIGYLISKSYCDLE
jgi:fluoride ion exporter CrcB/FEX